MGEFNTLSDTNYPKPPTDPPQDDSAGFVTPYKLATGATMGVQQIKGSIQVVDAQGVVRLVLGYSKDGF
jgi:hypothetical protein